MGGLGCSRDALDCLGKIVDRIGGVAGMVFDRATGEAGGVRREDRLACTLRAVALAFLQIRRDRQLRRPGDFATMMDHFLEADAAVGQPAREGEAGAGGGQSPEAEGGEKLGGADVPWVGNDEGARRLVKLPKHPALIDRTLVHEPPLSLQCHSDSIPRRRSFPSRLRRRPHWIGMRPARARMSSNRMPPAAASPSRSARGSPQ